ncbi:hypothetical protein COV82_05895 [Candidatus Peregrinibacteria bacterium CG11_big_fil_rev_8_21_14_0_20_46_8]|nr:MAG: hypothetical protein COV82_05895 [Candidatus Peregrinibacteria bacterium CG11_big_fil_rev_8_21_14_0_20_46_8]
MKQTNDRVDRYLRTVHKLGTPCYIYDGDIIKRQYSRLKEALPRCEILYSLRANPHPDVVYLLRNVGAGADVFSEGELERALRAGILAHNISFAGPGKTEDELRMAIGTEVAAIAVESIQELELLNALARQMGTQAHITLRIGTGKFGIDEEQLPEFLSQYQKCTNVIFDGLHFSTHAVPLDAQDLLAKFNHNLEFAQRIQREAGRPFKIINLGGGFCIPMFPGEKALDLTVFKDFAPHKMFPQTRFFIEAGRYLTGPAGVYIAKVLYTKKSRDTEYIIIDGGMHQNAFACGLYAKTAPRNFDIRILNKINAKPERTYSIAGPLCTSFDTLARDIQLPEVVPGDLICVLNSGAYGFSMSPLDFGSRQRPREILLSKS